MVQISCKGSSTFWSMLSGRVVKTARPSPQVPKNERLMKIVHIMSIGNLISGVNTVAVSYLRHFDSFLQNATDIITKCNSCFITKCDRSLLPNLPDFLSGFFITNYDNFVTKCYKYYKMQRLLQIATVRSPTVTS